MSGSDAFSDTKVVLYLLIADATKADRAEQVITTGGCIGVQVFERAGFGRYPQVAHLLARSVARMCYHFFGLSKVPYVNHHHPD
jgi:hypothetical protein